MKSVRPSRRTVQLFRLLSDSHPGDVLLVEQVDRLSRLKAGDWERLKIVLASRRVRVVALDLPTSWIMATGKVDEFTDRMFSAINGMLLDMLARSSGGITRTAAARCRGQEKARQERTTSRSQGRNRARSGSQGNSPRVRRAMAQAC